MGKRKSTEEHLLEEARKTVKEAPKRSLEYKEARKLLDEQQTKIDAESDAESEESENDSSESSEEEEEEEEESTQKVSRTRGGKRAKNSAGTSKKKDLKRKTLSGKKKPFKSTKKKVKTMVKNFVKEEDKQNEIHYEASIGQGFLIQLSQWMVNGKFYIVIRKPGTPGNTISVEHFKNITGALSDIEEKFENKVYFLRRNEKAKYPVRGTTNSAGFDLYSTEKKLLQSGKVAAIDTCIEVHLPKGTYGRIASRSGLALFNGIFVEAGVIDPDFRGTLMVVLFNSSKDDYFVEEGERIAQLILEKCSFAESINAEGHELHEQKERDTKGFGSTGKF